MKCRRCSECADSDHHWLDNPDFGNDPNPPPDVEPYNTDATHICKHCEALGMSCEVCDGAGSNYEGSALCKACKGEGVVAWTPDEASALAMEAAVALRESLGSIEQTAGEAGQCEQDTNTEELMWLDGVAICLTPYFERAMKCKA